MPKNIKDRYNEAGDVGKVGSTSKASRPLKGAYLLPVFNTDMSSGQVAQVRDIVSDCAAYVMTMVLTSAFVVVPGSTTYNVDDVLVAADIQWADTLYGEYTREFLDANGSYKDSFSRVVGTTTTRYEKVVLFDSEGHMSGGFFGTDAETVPELTITEDIVPFSVGDGETPDASVTNTGIQFIKIELDDPDGSVTIAALDGFEISSDEGATWGSEVTETPGVGEITLWIKFVETVAGDYPSSICIYSGQAYYILSVMGYLCDGTNTYPYRILIPPQLEALSNHSAAEYLQMADLDLSGYANWTPLCDGSAFSGVYDGGEFSITNLVCHPESGGAGLFFSSMSATFLNMRIIDADILAVEDKSAGILVADQAGDILTNIFVSGSVTSGTGSFVGLIAGVGSVASMSRISAEGEVSGEFAGGMFGMLSLVIGDELIENCICDATVVGIVSAAGMFGFVSGMSTEIFRYCLSCGAVDTGAAMAEGMLLPGETAPATITACVWDNTVNPTLADPDAGGIAGDTTEHLQDPENVALAYPGWDFDTIWNLPSTGNYPSLR